MRRTRACLLVCAGLLISAPTFSQPNSTAPADSPWYVHRYMRWFDEASAEFNVPVELLQAVAYAETRWQPRVPKGLAKKNVDEDIVEFEIDGHNDHMPPVFGIMGLRDDNYFGHSLHEAARLIGQSPETLKTDTQQNIRGAAALLASLSNGKNRNTPLEEWEEAVAKYSGIPQRDIAQMHTYEILNSIRLGRESNRFKINQRSVNLERAYGKSRLNTLSAPTVTIPLNDTPAR